MKMLPAFEERPEIIRQFADMADKMDALGIRYGMPMMGQPFGFQRFWLCSSHAIQNGLDVVVYLVIERASGVPFGTGETKARAIGDARAYVNRFGDYFDSLVALIIEERSRRQVTLDAEKILRPMLSIVESEETRVKEKRVPRRRLEVFNRSNGHCHYCACQLDLRGEWHVEHMMPKALGGSDEPGNLVASCIPCNQAKRDKTAEEFIAIRAKRGSAA